MTPVPVARLVYGYIIELREYKRIDATLGQSSLWERFMEAIAPYRDNSELIIVKKSI